MTDPSDEKAPQQVAPDTPDSGTEANREEREKHEDAERSLGEREFESGSE